MTTKSKTQTVKMTADELLVTRGALRLYLEGSFKDDRDTISDALARVEAAIAKAEGQEAR